MSATKQLNAVHLVGSVGLDSADEVFKTAGRLFGQRIKRIPDGEPGPRRLWVSFQYPFLRSSPFLRPDPSGEVRKISGFPRLCLAEGTTAEELRFPELGYAREARGSYIDFCEARARGDIAKGVRFQVCLPTPMGVTYAFCTRRDLLTICDAYEQAMVREVQRICRAIPHEDLSIQWDFCHELIMLDGQPQTDYPMEDASLNRIMERMATLGGAIPHDVEMGVHLCYGDFGAKHILEPKDAGAMVQVMNAMTTAMPRRIDYFHIPVPISRFDDAYFEPLQNLKLQPQTELYVGLVHASDGVAGAKKRIAAADRHIPVRYGVACECGVARQRTPQLVHRLLELHNELTATA